MMQSVKLGVKSVDFLTKCATKFAGPDNRLMLGIAALATQPFFDYYNKNVDERTRKYSVCKTIAKITIGTIVGVAVRQLAIKYSANFLNTKFISEKFAEVLKNPVKKELLQKTIGDILALGVCIFSNFLIDAPLTKLMTNFLAKNMLKERKNEH